LGCAGTWRDCDSPCKRLGLSQPTVSISVKRGEKRVFHDEKDYIRFLEILGEMVEQDTNR
jgi:hypothetical protein